MHEQWIFSYTAQAILLYLVGYILWGCKWKVKEQQSSQHKNQLLPKTYENVGFGAKLTSSADKEDDKSIANHRRREAGENPNHVSIA